MHSYIIYDGQDGQLNLTIDKLLKKHGAKILPFSLKKIEDVRKLRGLVKLSFSQQTAITINDIDEATIEAQNAFLKNLEEPPENLVYILTTKNINNVIETIQSRCEIIKGQGTKTYSSEDDPKIAIFLNSNIDYRFEYISKIKDRIEAKNFLNNLIYFNFKEKKFEDLELYLKTLENLKKNGNVALQLTNLVVKMDSHG